MKILDRYLMRELAGPFLFGVAVATTIGHEVVREASVTLPVIEAGLVSAIAWNLFTWFVGIPSSSSHALVGGLVGAVLVPWRLFRRGPEEFPFSFLKSQ